VIRIGATEPVILCAGVLSSGYYGREYVGGVACHRLAFRTTSVDWQIRVKEGASPIALLVAPLLVLVGYSSGSVPMGLQFWPGAVVMALVATLIAVLVTNGGRGEWFVGILVLRV
jgi:Ca2+:H+ antiporter